MMQKYWIFTALTFAAMSVYAQDAPVRAALPDAQAPADLGPLPDFRLLDQYGRSHTAHRFVDAAALVYMAIPREHPDLASRITAFRELAQNHADGEIFFFLVLPSARPDGIAELAGDLPLLLDEAQIALPALGLDEAFECVMAESSHWRVLFRGGLAGDGATTRGLTDALAAFREGSLAPFASATQEEKLALHPMPQNISYSQTIAPILAEKCVKCHSEGNVAPFAMDSHRRVAGWAEMMAETVRAGRMPPWGADPGFGHFSNSLALNTQETRVLLAWLEAGAPKDDAPDPLETLRPAPPTEWRLGKPDIVIALPEPQEVPASGILDYRYYDIPLNLPEGTWLRGTEVRVTEPSVMHHILVYLRRPGQDIDFTQEYIASYVPGHDPALFPEDTGKPVPSDASLLFQLHYTTNGRPVVDRPELGLYLHKSPPRHEVFLGSAVNHRFSIPPYATDHEVTATFRAPADILVYSLAPHMHYRGSRMHFEARYPSGEREVLLSVPDYDFLWQHSYHLAQPKRIPAGTEILVAGAFDNSLRNPLNPDPTQRLTWGEQSTEEMFIGSVFYRVAN
jgi:hypothetical protein